MKPQLISFLLSFVAGCLYALTYPSFIGGGWFPLLFVALPLFLWKLESSTTLLQALAMVFAYNLGLDVTGYYWIPHTLREFGQLPYVVSLILGTFFSLILQPHWWAYALWKRWRPDWTWTSQKGLLVTALAMTLLERYFPQQFPSYVGSPWLHLSPYLGLTPYLGVVAFSFLTYWVALETVAQLQVKKFRPEVWVTLVIFILINALMPIQNPEKKAELDVRIVQANVGNFLKVSSEQGDEDSIRSIVRKYKELSVKGDFNPDLIIWPETAYPDTFYGHQSQLSRNFTDIMDMTGAEMLIGGYDQDLRKSPFSMLESVFNSSILLSDNKVKTSYHKNILIPFGETLPFGPLNEKIVSIVPAVSLFARGEGTPLMETRGGQRFIAPICYEILDSNYMRDLLNQWKNNHFIVNHTNDSWYGDTAEPHQHLFLTKWRALEFMLPIIRSTNTGITSVIYPDGTESKRLGVGEEAALDVKLSVSEAQNTLYQLYGVFPFLGVFLLILGIIWWRERN